MIRRLLVVVPVAVLVAACGTPTLSAGTEQAADGVAATKSAPAAPQRLTQVAAKPTTSKRSVRKPATPKPVPAKPVPNPTTKRPAPKPAAASAAGCNVNYTPCVPNDPVDVDCQGGSGNGPSYVKGPVTVIGKDVYGLDADHNGIGCE